MWHHKGMFDGRHIHNEQNMYLRDVKKEEDLYFAVEGGVGGSIGHKQKPIYCNRNQIKSRW